MKKQYKTSLIAFFLVAIAACGMQAIEAVSSVSQTGPTTVLRPKTPSSIVLCRQKQCAPTRASMSREFLYNSLYSLFNKNLNTAVMFCDADELSRTCYEPYLQFRMMSGATPATVLLESASILDVQARKKQYSIDLALDYALYQNGIRPKCRGSKTVLFVKNPDYAIMEDIGFDCKFTTVSYTVMSTVYAIDYIDLDYGIIGAHYSIGGTGPAYGGGTGYLLMRFKYDTLTNPGTYTPEQLYTIEEQKAGRVPATQAPAQMATPSSKAETGTPVEPQRTPAEGGKTPPPGYYSVQPLPPK